jgi:hypothetical protein
VVQAGGVELIMMSNYPPGVSESDEHFNTADDEAEPKYKYPAAQQAYDYAGKDYADYIEAHTAELVSKGYDVGDRSLGEALAGNDGD